MKQDWNHKKLTDLCAIQYGFAFDSSYFNDSGDGLPLIRIRDVVRGFSETYYSGAYPPEYIVKKGDYLIGMDGEFNIAQWKGGEALLNQRVCKISSKSDSYIERFAYYFLCRILKEIEDETPFVTVKHLSAKRLNQILTPVPSIEEQKKICSLLDKMNRVIEAKKEQLKELDNLAQAIFYDMFGDPVTNEKGWETKQLGDTGEIVAGSTPSTTDSTNWDGNINWVTPAELNNQLFYGSTQRKLTEKGASGLTLMPTGTVLLSSRAPIGKLAITTEPMCCNQGFKNIVCGNKLNNIFLYYYLRLTMDNVKALGVGATFKEVSKKAISAYPIILPPLPLQQAFAEKVEAIERQKELINQSLREVQTLFDSRMDYWFSEEDDDLGQLDKLD